jgi:16S rRNA (uracil1498-N3)-methyltransferase
MHLFYTPGISGDSHVLDEQESRHAIRVLRLGRGDQVILVDGVGGWYEAVILEDHPKTCRLGIRSRTAGYKALPYHLHIAMAPTKNMDRFEWFLEKATEIGISEITPLICHRSERSRVNQERLERILVSAMKQSFRAYKPVLHIPVNFGDFIAEPREGTRGIAHCIPEPEGSLTPRTALTAFPRSNAYTMLVGPEGDFTEEEVQKALASDFLPFHLGEARMRTETAGVFICASLNILSQSSL